MTSEFGLILCELCGSIMDEGNTEDYFENHGHNGSERLSRTTCCRASYTDVDGQTIIDELVQLREAFHYNKVGLDQKLLDQITRDNLDAIIPILEKAFDL